MYKLSPPLFLSSALPVTLASPPNPPTPPTPGAVYELPKPPEDPEEKLNPEAELLLAVAPAGSAKEKVEAEGADEPNPNETGWVPDDPNPGLDAEKLNSAALLCTLEPNPRKEEIQEKYLSLR